IIPVQVGGSDSTQNLILVCPTCHELIHKYEKQQFNPEQETYDRNNDIKRIVVLGNMILKMRGNAINTLKNKFPKIHEQVDRGSLTIGQGVKKAGLDLQGEEDYDGSTYKVFHKLTEDIDYGGEVK